MGDTTPSRTRHRVVELLYSTEASDEEVEAHFDKIHEVCCDGEEECILLTGSLTVHYIDEDGRQFDRPEGGVPVYTSDLDDYEETSMCGAAVTLPDESPSGVTTCTREPDHNGPHYGPLTWT